MFWLLRALAAVNVLALLGVCAFLLCNGLPALSWEFLTQPPRKMMTEGGIWPCIVGTAVLSLGALALAFPWACLRPCTCTNMPGATPLPVSSGWA